MLWGAFRIRLGLRKPGPDAEGGRVMGGGFARMNPRTNVLLGVVYVLFGIALLAASFGWNPIGNAFGPDTQTPSKDKAPTKSGIPVDQLPTKKPS